MRKPPKPRPGRPHKPVSVAKAKAPEAARKGPLARAWGVLAGISTLLGLLAIFSYWPQISVEPSAAADLSANPLSQAFRVTNEKGYPIEDLNVEVSLRCAKIGRSDTSPINKCEPSMHTQSRRWAKHTLGPHEPYDVNPGEVMFVTPNALLYAQLDLFVSFQPWKIPWSFSRAFRFETRRLSDGTIQWFHIPSD